MTPDTPPLGAGDLLGNAGPLPAVTLGGKAYTLARPSPGTVAAVEIRLHDSAYEPLDAAMERATTPTQRDRIQRQVDLLNDQFFGRGEHKCGQPAWEAAFETPRGLTLIVWACIRQNHPEFTEADAARLAASHPAAWARAVAHVMAPFAEAVGAHLGGDPTTVAATVRAGMAEHLPAVTEALSRMGAADRPT